LLIFSKTLIVIFILIFSNNALSKELPEISVAKKLWNIEINNKEKKEIKNIFQNIKDKEHKKALKTSSKIYKSVFKDAFYAISYLNQINSLNIKEINLISHKYPFFNQQNINIAKEKYIMDNDLDYKEIKNYYSNYHNSKNKDFLIYLIDKKLRFYKEGDFDQNLINLAIKDKIKNLWINYDLSKKNREEFLTKYKDFLEDSDHINKIKRLFWEKRISDGKKLFDLISPDQEKLFQAIIKINKNPKI
jgi:hypothetical protein